MINEGYKEFTFNIGPFSRNLSLAGRLCGTPTFVGSLRRLFQDELLTTIAGNHSVLTLAIWLSYFGSDFSLLQGRVLAERVHFRPP